LTTPSIYSEKFRSLFIYNIILYINSGSANYPTLTKINYPTVIGVIVIDASYVMSGKNLLRSEKLFSSGRKKFSLGREQKKPPFPNQPSAITLQPSNPPITITAITPTLIYYIKN